MNRDALKRQAAEAAVAMVEPGMLVGLGTGSTARHAITLLGQRHRDGLRMTGVATSMASARQARELGIPLIEQPSRQQIDLTIDGADEIGVHDLSLIKGAGGALLREKIVAASSRWVVIVADETKLAEKLSGRVVVPVEVEPFGWETTMARLHGMGCEPSLKRAADGAPFLTDGGHFILNCLARDLSNPAGVEDRLAQVVGVIETGLFVGLATTVFIASESGVRRFDRGG